MAEKQRNKTGKAEKPHYINITFGICASLAALATVYGACTQFRLAQRRAEMLPIVVLDGTAQGSPVVDAEVSLNIPDLNPEHTDTKGQIYFRLPENVVGLDGRLSIRKSGFENFNQQILLQPRSDFYRIYLAKVPVAAAPSTSTSRSEARTAKAPQAGSAQSIGNQSPAVSGSANNFSYGAPGPDSPRKTAVAPGLKSTMPTLPPGSAVSGGDQSPAVSGSGNSFNYGTSEPPVKKKDPQKKDTDH